MYTYTCHTFCFVSEQAQTLFRMAMRSVKCVVVGDGAVGTYTGSYLSQTPQKFSEENMKIVHVFLQCSVIYTECVKNYIQHMNSMV